jgi:hypothetical protein
MVNARAQGSVDVALVREFLHSEQLSGNHPDSGLALFILSFTSYLCLILHTIYKLTLYLQNPSLALVNTTTIHISSGSLGNTDISTRLPKLPKHHITPNVQGQGYPACLEFTVCPKPSETLL